MTEQRRVCVSGIGVISPLGTGHDIYWKRLIAGESGIKSTTNFKFPVPADEPSLRVSAPLDFDALDHVDDKLPADIYWANRLLIHSAYRAMQDAGLTAFVDNTAIVLGAGASSTLCIEQYEGDLLQAIRSGEMLSRIPRDFSSSEKILGAHFDLHGEQVMVATACSSSSLALGIGYDQIVEGTTDYVIVGCVDTLCQLTHSGFYGLRSIDPERSRPFDKNRRGISIGEASVVLLLEAEDSVKARGHVPYCTMEGWWANCDAIAMTAPDSSGQTLIRLMRDAMSAASVDIEEIDYICAHGTGTELNDQIESVAISEVFSARQAEMPFVSSVKGAIGHCMAAAGIMNALTVVLAIKHGQVPGNTGLLEKDEKCAIDPIKVTQPCCCRAALSNAFAFGGNNTCIVFRKWEAGNV